MVANESEALDNIIHMCMCQKLSKLVGSRLSYCNTGNKNSAIFMTRTLCILGVCIFNVNCKWRIYM